MRLIDADELVEKLGKEYRMKGAKQVKGNFMNYIYHAPTVDAKPVVHGRWVNDCDCPHCSACLGKAAWFFRYGYYEPKYCPKCGAKMDLQEES